MRYSTGQADCVDTLNYEVAQVNAESTVLTLLVVPGPKSSTKGSKSTITLKPSGALASAEESSNLDLQRVARMEWTALEAREGIEWSRNWPASGGLLEAKVNVKPITRTKVDTTMTVTYKEGVNTKCVATIKVLNSVRIAENVEVTFPDGMTYAEKLKELQLADSKGY